MAEATLAATLPHLPGIVADMVKLQRLLGCRPGELCAMRPGSIERCGDVWRFVPEHHKTEHHGRRRVIFIGPKAQAILLPYLLRPADACCFSPADSEAKRHAEQRQQRRSRVQPSQQNRRQSRRRRAPRTSYDKNGYARCIKRAAEKADEAARRAAIEAGQPVADNERLVPHWHPKQLRHAAGTEVRKRFGLEAAQVVLGHAKADVTQVYAERDFTLAAQIAKQIG